MDVPNFVGASKQLLNDIDLMVTGPINATSPSTWWGNDNENVDDLNNAEMVLISDPKCGLYEVTLVGGLFLDPQYQLVSIVITSSGGVVLSDEDDIESHSSGATTIGGSRSVIFAFLGCWIIHTILYVFFKG